jgi:hypothetical protein
MIYTNEGLKELVFAYSPADNADKRRFLFFLCYPRKISPAKRGLAVRASQKIAQRE